MAAHHIYTKVNSNLNDFIDALLVAFSDLAWEYEQKSNNYYKLKIINRDLYENLHLVPKDAFAEHGLSGHEKWSAQVSSSLISGLSSITNRIGFLKKTVEASEKLAKGFMEQFKEDYFFPEIMILPQEEKLEVIFSHSSNENKSLYLILTYLILKHSISKGGGFGFDSYEYHVKEKSKALATKSVRITEKENTAKPPKPSPALVDFISMQKTRIAENNVQACLKDLDHLFGKVKGDHYKEFAVLQSEFHRLRKEVVGGLISYEDAELKRNQINHRLLLLITLLEEDDEVMRFFHQGAGRN